MKPSFRLDLWLTQKNPNLTRSQAQLLIREGKVLANGKKVMKPSLLVNEGDKIKILEPSPYVGRGAYKIKAAVEEFGLDPKDKVIADIGASTGGFTDYLLQNGATKNYAIDVGHDQLAEKLRSDPRVVNLEGVNMRNGIQLPEKVDWAVVDLSFISLRLALAQIRKLLKRGGQLICLFKPQFEVGPSGLNKKGVVKNEYLRKKALDDFLEWCGEEKWTILGVMESPVVGKEGNREVLVWIRSIIKPDTTRSSHSKSAMH